MKKKLKPLPTFKTPPKTMSAFKRRVIRLLSHGWARGPYATDSCGQSVDEMSPDACAVCFRGASNRALTPEPMYAQFREMFIREIGSSPIIFSDKVASDVSEVITAVRKVPA